MNRYAEQFLTSNNISDSSGDDDLDRFAFAGRQNHFQMHDDPYRNLETFQDRQDRLTKANDTDMEGNNKQESLRAQKNQVQFSNL